MFGIDVQALYPSVNFEHLATAIVDCLNSCTDWSLPVKSLLLEIIIYTLEEQQIVWNGGYYKLNKGIPTGGRHCVPLANILLTYILKDLVKSNIKFRMEFETNLKLWKRFIDDCAGVHIGRDNFLNFFNMLNEHCNKFDLNLTYESSPTSIHFLDIEIFITENKFHTKEHRKETASNSYIKFGSAHPKHCFKGIIKSQLTRLRRLCSRDTDFIEAVDKLRDRCIKSGYDTTMVNQILSQACQMERILTPTVRRFDSNFEIIRWVILSGTPYEKQIRSFTNRINRSLHRYNIKLEIVKSTGPSISKLLFSNNTNKSLHSNQTCNDSCAICTKQLRIDSNVTSPTNGRTYSINRNLNCTNSGIYCISCPCTALYTGKTTTSFSQRFNEHFISPGKTVYDHSLSCQLGERKENFSIHFLENIYSRGKYSLSEREYLWNERLRGVMNIQKILKS